MFNRHLLELTDTEITLIMVALEKFRDENEFSERGTALLNRILKKIDVAMGEEDEKSCDGNNLG